jgi:flagellar M-ring protein FliF
VLVDGVYETVDGVEKYRPRTAEELAQLSALVKGVVGFDDTRGDVLQIESTRFFNDPTPQTPLEPTTLVPRWYRWYYGAAAAAVILLLSVGGIALLMRRAARNVRVSSVNILAGGDEAPPPALGENASAPALPAPRLGDPDRLRSEAIEMALRDPDTASVVLREWLNAGPSARGPVPSGTVHATNG